MCASMGHYIKHGVVKKILLRVDIFMLWKFALSLSLCRKIMEVGVLSYFYCYKAKTDGVLILFCTRRIDNERDLFSQ